MKIVGAAVWVVAACALGCGASDRGAALDDESCGDGGCTSSSHDAGVDPDADTYKGPRATVTGSVSFMEAPDFPPFPSEPLLTKPARVHFPYRGHDYFGDWPGAGAGTFTLSDIPAQGSFVMVSDLEGGNGVFPTIVPATPGNGGVWSIGAVRQQALADIYTANGLTFDPNKAHAIVSVWSSVFTGYTPLAGVEVTLSGAGEATLYDVSGGTFAKGSGTGPLGLAIIANADAGAYPGQTLTVRYTVGSRTTDLDAFLARGAVSRIAITDEGSSGGP